jgi:2'-5' RNA ligase
VNLQGIASRLGLEHDARVRSLWTSLAADCGLTGIAKTPIPHMSWVVGDGFKFESLSKELAGLARSQRPFEARTTGLGVFTGEADIVLYLAVIKDEPLAAFHRAVWKAAAAHIETPSAYYTPSAWVPHITLAHGDVDPEGLACAARLLARENLHWTIPVTEFSLVFQEAETAEEYTRFQLE